MKVLAEEVVRRQGVRRREELMRRKGRLERRTWKRRWNEEGTVERREESLDEDERKGRVREPRGKRRKGGKHRRKKTERKKKAKKEL